MTSLKTTPLHAAHQRLGARLIDFAGYEMPVRYGSILEEHKAVRERAAAVRAGRSARWTRCRRSARA